MSAGYFVCFFVKVMVPHMGVGLQGAMEHRILSYRTPPCHGRPVIAHHGPAALQHFQTSTECCLEFAHGLSNVSKAGLGERCFGALPCALCTDAWIFAAQGPSLRTAGVHSARTAARTPSMHRAQMAAASEPAEPAAVDHEVWHQHRRLRAWISTHVHKNSVPVVSKQRGGRGGGIA